MRVGWLVRALAVTVALVAPLAGAWTGPDMGALAAPAGVAPTAGVAYTITAPVAPEAASRHSISVPNYYQQRNLSCEYASAVIAMASYGVWVSEWEFDGIVGWSENPHWGYRGDINGTWGNTEDYGVYASALVPALNAFGFWGDAFYAGGDSSALTTRLDAGHPTLIWIGMWGNTGYYEYTEDGTPYKLVPGLHVVVAHDYDDTGVYVSDPATGTTRFFDWGTFMWMWNAVDGMGLAVGPY